MRWLALAIVIAIAMPLLLRWSTTMMDLLRIHRVYQRCAAMSPPPSKVVYTEDPSERDRLLKEPDYGTVGSHNGPVAFHVPAVWPDFNRAAARSRINTQGTFFLHELATPDRSKRRLVGVDLNGWSRGTEIELYTTTRVYAHTTFLRVPPLLKSYAHTLRLSPHEAVLRVFAGQVDPSDPSHFTIDYTIDDKLGTIDGWLKNDDLVLIEPRPTATTTSP